MGNSRILVAGIGNVFLGDDAFGVEVAQKLARRKLPAGVRVIDFGIRSLDLTYALLDGWDVAILVDAAPRGGEPGTLYLIEPDGVEPAAIGDPVPMLDMHNLDPAKVLRLVGAMGGHVGRVLLVACDPAPLDPDQDMVMGLSPPVKEAVDRAIPMIQSLLAKLTSAAAPDKTTAAASAFPPPPSPENWQPALFSETAQGDRSIGPPQ